jgi:hypothetical protein
MKNRLYTYRKIAVLLALAGFAIALLPEMASAFMHIFDHGAEGLGIADFVADSTLLVAVALAALGLVAQRSWGRWIGRGIGLYWLARVGGGLFVYGTVRPFEMLLLFGAGLLVISLPPPEKAYENAPSSGSTAKRALGGWALAFNVALLPVLLAPINGTVANALDDSLVTLALVASALATVAAIGTLMVLWARTLGLILCAAANLAALLYFWQMVAPRSLGHHELFLIVPSTIATMIAAAILALPSLRSLTARADEPIL